MKYVSSFLFLIVVLCFAGALDAQSANGIIASNRVIDWSSPGVPGGIPARSTACATLNPGATAAQINTAIQNCTAGQHVKLNAGTYTLNAGIDFTGKNDVTLRGAGANSTFLNFTGKAGCGGWSGASVCFMGMSGDGGDADYGNAASWTAGYSIGTQVITINNFTKGSGANLQVGSMVFLDQLDDASCPNPGTCVCESSACSTEGTSGNGRSGRHQLELQIVTSKSGSGPWTIGISPGVRMPNIVSGKSPGIWFNSGLPSHGNGIEDVALDHSGSSPASGVFMFNTWGNWVKGVKSRDASTNGIHKHVWLYQGFRNTIRDSYFYGGGDAGNESYGVDSLASADTLVENNIFQHTSNPQMNEGCIGCVQAYNYAIDDYYTGSGLDPYWQQASAYHHSVGDAFTLWEGNVGIGFTADTVHGSSNFGTIFRNFFNGRDPQGGSPAGKTEQTNAIILNAYNRYYNIIGNVLGTAGYHSMYEAKNATTADAYGGDVSRVVYLIGYSGNYGSHTSAINNDTVTHTGLMRWGNYDVVGGTVRWISGEVPSSDPSFPNTVPSNHTLPASFYLSSKPTWWGTVAWPPIGPDVTGGNITGTGGYANKIPAQLCYENTPKVSGVLSYDAATCYPNSGGSTGSAPAPTGVQTTVR